jgi:hypothetical protein
MKGGNKASDSGSSKQSGSKSESKGTFSEKDVVVLTDSNFDEFVL